MQPKVGGAVVVNCRIREEADPLLLPGGPPIHLALGQWVSWGPREQGLGPAGLHRPHKGPPLAKPRPEVVVNLSPSPASVT